MVFIFVFFSQDQTTPISSMPFAHLTLPLCIKSSTRLWPGLDMAHLSLPTKTIPGQTPGTQPSHPLRKLNLSSSSRDEERLSSIHTPRASLGWDPSVRESWGTCVTANRQHPQPPPCPFREPGCSPAVHMKLVFQCSPDEHITGGVSPHPCD